MKLLSWNTAGRTNKIEKQYEAINIHNPDIICLQEIQFSGEEKWQKVLSTDYDYVISSFNHIQERSKTGPRKYHLMIASKKHIKLDRNASKHVPWEERLLVVKLENYNLRIATAHIPPGGNNGWIKIDFFEGLYDLLTENNIILMGDFNSPKKEFLDGTTMTWGQNQNSKGEIKIRHKIKGKEGRRWHVGEYNLLRGIEKINYLDYFRYLHGYKVEAFSWLTNTNRDIKYRFDHAIGPNHILPSMAKYDVGLIHQRLSDHAPLIINLKILN
jgi:exonuclease III